MAKPSPNIYRTNTMNCEALSIFSGTFNKRPDVELYYSEKLFTKSQILAYENAVKQLKNPEK